MQHQQHSLNNAQHIPVPFKHSLRNVLLPLQLEVTFRTDRPILIMYVMKIKVKRSLYMSHDDVAALILNAPVGDEWSASPPPTWPLSLGIHPLTPTELEAQWAPKLDYMQKSFAHAGNQIAIHHLNRQQPSHYTDCIILTLTTSEVMTLNSTRVQATSIMLYPYTNNKRKCYFKT